ncbi:MAG: Uma2 family endonuclease [Planctomycetota bacterium]|nr:Uma2 family endonuclease [Planctomycetota bacterium]
MSDTKIYPTTYLDLPTSDDQPMGETEAHGIEMTVYLRDVLRYFYADDPMIYVASNNFVYYDPSDVKKNVCPDCYVIKGIPKIVRDSYQAWAEGGALPNLIFELTSHSTWRVDIDHKRELYQSWGCHEYFLYDLTADRILGHLLGYRLENGVYQEIPGGVQGRLYSEELQLELAHQDGHLRFFIPGASQPILTHWEKVEKLENERDQAEQDIHRAEQERIRAVALQLQAEKEREQERLWAEQEIKQERLRAEQAEAELARLKEEIASLGERNQDA